MSIELPLLHQLQEGGMSDIPDWIETRVQLCRDVLGCNGYYIIVRMRDAPNGDEDTKGMAHLAPEYLNAVVTFNRGLQEDNELDRSTVAHEMVHVAMMEFESYARLIIEMLPEQQQAFAYELFRRSLEPTTQRIARALTPFLDQWQEKEEQFEAKDNVP